MAGHVFVSYSRTDVSYVNRLADALARAGLSIWKDDRDLEIGDRWEHGVRDRVDDCAAMVIVMSPAAEASINVANELARARDRGKTIVPVLLSGEVWFALSTINYFDARDRERVLGPDHPSTFGSRNNLAHTYQLAGQVDEALALFTRTLADRERVLGPDHPNTLGSRHNLAQACQAVGRIDEAVALFTRALADRVRVLGPEHPHTRLTRNSLAHAYRAAGRGEEADTLLRPDEPRSE